MDWCQKKLALSWSCTSFDDLPDGLVVDIFLKLPVKTLLQSTCVSKLWYSVINSASFISTHLSRSISNPLNYYIFLGRYDSPPITVVFDNHDLLTHLPDFIFPFDKQSISPKLIGSCNGLVCFTDYDCNYRGRDIYLINPSIHKHKKLDVEFSCYADFIREIKLLTGYIDVGFGYSEFENDYKVLRIIRRVCNTTKPLEFSTKIEIYSLRSGKWKCVELSFEIEIQPYACSVYVQGCLYWHLPNGYLLCFNLKDEVFSKIELPSIYHKFDPTWGRRILEKNGFVAVVVYYEAPVAKLTNSVRIHLIVLEKNDAGGGQVRWKELYYECARFTPKECFGFSGVGRLIFSELDCDFPTDYIVAVDLDNSGEIERLALDFINIFNGATNVFESLIDVTGEQHIGT